MAGYEEKFLHKFIKFRAANGKRKITSEKNGMINTILNYPQLPIFTTALSFKITNWPIAPLPGLFKSRVIC